HLADDVGSFERDAHIRKRLFQLVTHLLLQHFGDWRRTRFQRHADHRLVLTAGEQVNRVDRIIWGLHADEPGRDLHILRTDQVLDDVHRLHLDELGPFKPGSSWRAEAKLELPALDRGKNLGSYSGIDEGDESEGDEDVDADNDPAQAEHRQQPLAI